MVAEANEKKDTRCMNARAGDGDGEGCPYNGMVDVPMLGSAERSCDR